MVEITPQLRIEEKWQVQKAAVVWQRSENRAS